MERHADIAALVGREQELERFDATLDALDLGREAVLAIEGEPGIGKTRVLTELRMRAERRGQLVLAGTATEYERDLPFSVWVDALDAHVASRSQVLRGHAAWDDALARELAAILPSLARAAGAGADEEALSPIADERFRAHRAMRSLLSILSEDQALVVVLDDLHWSDPASLELLGALLQRGVAAPVVLAVAFRPGQAPQRLTAALATPRVERVALAPLDAEQAAQLVGADTARALLRHAGGNPFYLQELARAPHLPTGPEGAFTGEVPAAVAGALAQELETLPAAARALLDGAAVAGEPFEPDLAAAIAQLTPAQGLDALDELLAVGLVRPTQVPRRFRFRHPLVRSAVYASAPGGWTLAAHARAADTLAARGAGAAERARHVEYSARPGDADAIALLLEAGADTVSRAPAAAAHWYEAALRLLGGGDRARRAELLVVLASAQRSAGELEACRETLLEAEQVLPADGDGAGARRIELTAFCAAVEHWLGRHAEAHQRLLRAWERLPDQHGAEAAALQIELAVDAMYEMDGVRAAQMARGALEIARTLDRPALTAGAAAALALADALQGDVEPALRHRAEAVALIDRLSDAELAPRLEALYLLGWAENYLERYDDAVAHAERGIAIARATGQGRLLVPLMLVMPYSLEMIGRLAEAREICGGALEAARLAGNPHFVSWALYEQAWVDYYAGELEQTIAACEESYRVGRRLVLSTMPASGGGPGWPMASARLLMGEPQALLDLVAGFGDDTLPWAVTVEKCFVWETMSLAAAETGDAARAEQLVQRAEQLSGALELGVPAGVALRARSALLLGEGEGAAAGAGGPGADGGAAGARGAGAEVASAAAAGAVAAAQDSTARLLAVGADLQAAYSQQLLGHALLLAGDRAGALATWREAEHVFDRSGSARARDEVRRELRSLGARVEPRGPATAFESGLSALTRREREIADLVTDRLTNREIAARLFLSEKTVESHVRNILRKLGASSRIVVARTVERERERGA